MRAASWSTSSASPGSPRTPAATVQRIRAASSKRRAKSAAVSRGGSSPKGPAWGEGWPGMLSEGLGGSMSAVRRRLAETAQTSPAGMAGRGTGSLRCSSFEDGARGREAAVAAETGQIPHREAAGPGGLRGRLSGLRHDRGHPGGPEDPPAGAPDGLAPADLQAGGAAHGPARPYRTSCPSRTRGYVEGRFVIVSLLGEGTLAERLRRRMSLRTALDLGEQLLAGLAHAHENNVIHCDVKPENFILFPDKTLRLTDFGIALVALRTMEASGSGTIGYMAPEQALGRPSVRSDVFAAGLVLYRMFAGTGPREWPFEWPPPGYERIRRRLHPDLIEIMRRSLRLDPRQRFDDRGAHARGLRNGTQPRREPRPQRHPDGGRPRRTAWTGASCSSATSRASTAPRWRRSTSAGAARARSQRACAPAPGADRAARPTAEPRASRRVARAAGAARSSTGAFCAWCYGAAIGPRRGARVLGQALRCSLRQPLLHAARAHALHALLSLGAGPRCGASGRSQTRRTAVRAAAGALLSEYWSTCPWCMRKLGKARPQPSTAQEVTDRS